MLLEDQNTLFLQNIVHVPQSKPFDDSDDRRNYVGKIIRCLAEYNYTISFDLYDAILERLNLTDMRKLNTTLKIMCKRVSGADKPINEHLVYQNFHKQVRGMSENQYWYIQYIIYLTQAYPMFDYELPDVEAADIPFADMTVLQLSDTHLSDTLQGYVASKTVWTDDQKDFVTKFFKVDNVNAAQFGNKTNLANYGVAHIVDDRVAYNHPNEVLRLMAAYYDQDPMLQVAPKWPRIGRPMRRIWLGMLEATMQITTTCMNDMVERREVWSKLFYKLRPHDYGNTYSACLTYVEFSSRFKTYNGRLDYYIKHDDLRNIAKLAEVKPGIVFRNVVRILRHDWSDADYDDISLFLTQFVGNLTLTQLVKLEAILSRNIELTERIVFPKGSTHTIQVIPQERYDATDLYYLLADYVSSTIRNKTRHLRASANLQYIRLGSNYKGDTQVNRFDSVKMGVDTEWISAYTYWDNNMAAYFDIGAVMIGNSGSVIETCTWNSPHGNSAVFSGDTPLTSKGSQGIDIDVRSANDRGIQYIMITATSYDHIPFDKSQAYMGLYWGKGERANSFEPKDAKVNIALNQPATVYLMGWFDLYSNTFTMCDMGLLYFKEGDVKSRFANSSITSSKREYARLLELLRNHVMALPNMSDLLIKVTNEPSEDHMNVLYDSTKADGDTQGFVKFNNNPEATSLKQLIDIEQLVS